jgi:hypothetical protein
MGKPEGDPGVEGKIILRWILRNWNNVDEDLRDSGEPIPVAARYKAWL